MEAFSEGDVPTVRMVPETRSKGSRRWSLRWFPLALTGLVFLAVVALTVVPRGGSFEIGEQVPGEGVEDIVVSDQDALYPPPDVETFSVPPKTLHVYLVVEGLTSGELEAGVERSGRATVFSWLFSERRELEVGDEESERLARDDGTVSGLIRFSIRSRGDEAMLPGNYTVTVRQASGGSLVAEKSFVVRE